ncbi:hypothetical protein [Glycomyces sp. YM15]|uniref:hypothetical protein n=1 Tax=Glycomyces sp. YM15 TaxID=2800446 RepID=UPI0019625431|nr:hypothetical protein [Glycomyces sp. YM15]
MLLGFAYLLLYALASGPALPLVSEPGPREGDDEPDEGTTPATTPPQVGYRPRPHRRDPHEPGLHFRPDGSRYLVVPLHFAGAAA